MEDHCLKCIESYQDWILDYNAVALKQCTWRITLLPEFFLSVRCLRTELLVRLHVWIKNSGATFVVVLLAWQFLSSPLYAHCIKCTERHQGYECYFVTLRHCTWRIVLPCCLQSKIAVSQKRLSIRLHVLDDSINNSPPWEIVHEELQCPSVFSLWIIGVSEMKISIRLHMWI